MEKVFITMIYLGGILQCVFWCFPLFIMKIEKTTKNELIMIPRMKLRILFILSVALLVIGLIGGSICRFLF
jgi:hypothetical protein